MNGPMVSIIIPVYNRYDLTRECIESIFRVTSMASYEVILIDNGSTDPHKTIIYELKAKYPALRCVFNATNLGFAKACNQGADISMGTFLLFLNNDTKIIQPNWIQHMLDVFMNDDRVGCVGAKLVFPNGSIEHAGLLIKRIITPNGTVLMDGELRLFGAPPHHPDVNVPVTLAAVSGACLMTPRYLFEQVGGFDDSFWNGCEDVDYCLKVKALGYKIVYQPRSVLIHLKSQSGPERFRKARENMLLLARRWGNTVEADVEIRYKLVNIAPYPQKNES